MIPLPLILSKNADLYVTVQFDFRSQRVGKQEAFKYCKLIILAVLRHVFLRCKNDTEDPLFMVRLISFLMLHTMMFKKVPQLPIEHVVHRFLHQVEDVLRHRESSSTPKLKGNSR